MSLGRCLKEESVADDLLEIGFGEAEGKVKVCVGTPSSLCISKKYLLRFGGSGRLRG